jgi:WD40 repeat protein
MPEQPLPPGDSGKPAVERFLGVDERHSAEGAPPGYEVLAELGRGDMGVVYKARHLRLARVVALKMIRGGGHAAVGDRLRFLGEAEVVASLQHPHVVSLLEYGEHEGLPFFTQEFVPGGSLTQRLGGVPWSAREAVRLIEQLARGVHYAHTRGIVHRDIKPANVLFAEDGTPKIADFALARRDEPGSGLTATGEVLGAPSYMAPEQASGETKHDGPAADIYALGAIFYECLTGRPPFRAANPAETVLNVVSHEPASVRQLQPSTPADVVTVCDRCLQKDPHKRYASALDLAEDCAAYLEGKPIRARPLGKLERAWRWCRRNPALAGALAAGVASLLLGSIVALVFGFRAEAARWSEQLHAESEARTKQFAEKSRRSAQRQLIDLCVASGATAARDGDHALALLWFARAVQHSGDDLLEEELNRIRVANWLRQVWLPEGTFAVPGFRQNQDRYRQLQFSADGNYLVVVVSTGGCLVWDRRQGRLVELAEAEAHGTAAAWQPRSNVLAVATRAGPIHLLAAPEFRPVEAVAVSGEIAVIAFSRDGKRLAWGGSAGARVWDRDKKAYVTPVLASQGSVAALAFNSTGDRLAAAFRDRTARVFRVPTDTPDPLFLPVRHGVEDGEYRHTGPEVGGPRFAAADQVLLTVDDEGDGGPVLRWRSADTGQVLASHGDTGVFAVSDHEKYVAALGAIRGRLFDAATRQVVLPIPAPPRGMWNEQVIFSTDQKTVVTCSHDSRVRFWSVEDRSADTLSEAYPPIHHPMVPVRVGLSADGRHLAVGLWDGSLYLWRLPQGPPIAYLAHAGGTTAPALSPDKQYILPRGVTDRDGHQLATRVYDADSGQPAGPTLDPGGILLDVAFSPDGTQIVTASSTGRTVAERGQRMFASDGSGGTVQIWDWKSGKRLVRPVPMPGEPRGLAFRPDGHMLAVVCADYHVVLVDPGAGTIARRLDPGLRTHLSDTNQWQSNSGARFSPDGRFLITWEMTPHVHIWDPDSGKLVHTLAPTERVGRVAVAPTAPELLATAGWGSDARVWDMATGQLLVALKHPQWVTDLAFTPDAKELLTGAADGLLRVWDWRSGTLRGGWPLHTAGFGFHFTMDRRWLVAMDDLRLEAIDWPTKTPASPRWKTLPARNVALQVAAGDRRAVVGGSHPSLVAYDLEAMRIPATDAVDHLVALLELAAGRRILNQGIVVPLTSIEWAERWDLARQAHLAALKPAANADRAEGR